MGAKNLLGVALGLLFVVNLATATDFVFEFGNRILYDLPIALNSDDVKPFPQGVIGKIGVPVDVSLNYVKVTVTSTIKPKVDFSFEDNLLAIYFPHLTIYDSISYNVEGYGLYKWTNPKN